MDQEQTGAAAWSSGRRLVFSHSPGGSTFLLEVTSWPPSWKYNVVSEIWLRQSMRSYLRNNHAEFHPDPTWAFLNEKHKHKKNSYNVDMRSVP